jgi:hypothetical protein
MFLLAGMENIVYSHTNTRELISGEYLASRGFTCSHNAARREILKQDRSMRGENKHTGRGSTTTLQYRK